jgi:hypothetical protein
MKKVLVSIAITASTIVMACKGNPEGAMGVNDKADTTAFDQKNEGAGRAKESTKDSTNKNIGPAQDKNHVVDSEEKKKH